LALKQHLNDRVRFDQQVDNSTNYVLPFIEQTKKMGAGINVLEVGCAEGGVLKPFIEKGCSCVGVDLAENRIALAQSFLKEEVTAGNVHFLTQNIYEQEFIDRYQHQFDVIILKDVIEHVPEQEKFVPHLKTFLREGGLIFFGFPPWYMPFGGHQQVAKNKLVSMMPYYHILPKGIYAAILKSFKEHPGTIQELLEVKDTQITIERFEKIIKDSQLRVLAKQHYLINPIYKFKFGLKPRKQFSLLSAIPFFRNFVTTCVYYSVG
jgi:SAM-dependent methyltransferase